MLKSQLIGNLGQDAKLQQNGPDNVLNFSVGVNKKIKNPDGTYKDITTWVNCSKWYRQGATTTLTQYLTKGSKVYIHGDLRVRDYTDRNGERKFSIDVLCDQIELLGAKKESDTSGPHADFFAEPPATVGDGMPF